ncbi:hypothetical protein CN675_08815 [Bacillus toyonensis]|uniref:hypothetical protein n=1 Tax=Bacillus toyonensis TaxID=155322 RepID=UPI000BF11A72|nr:hypothetical protein [Bacillus toyonensis]PEJ20493.1 hypothetical protein CN675_08815 [Bacillus toyonensis]PEP08197.1 hypothetical protein CN577_11725 [Bacillus toyonensis]
MSYDTIASLQRMEQLEQAQAAAGKRLILKPIYSSVDAALIIVAVILFIPTFTFSLVAFLVYYYTKFFFMKTRLVKNVATGEKFYVDKEDFKQYKQNFKKNEKQVRKISDL